VGLKRTSHSVYDTSYRLVRCPKYRRKIFEREEVRERAEQMIGEICEAYDIEVPEMEILEEHIHLLVSLPPARSIGEVVRIIKSHNGRGLFREFPGLKKRLWGGEIWEDDYFVRTVGDRMTWDVIAEYIEHHRELEQEPAQLALKLRS
jgi:putative transposase